MDTVDMFIDHTNTINATLNGCLAMRNISVFVILIHFPFLATGFLRRIQNTSESYLLFIHY